MERRTLLISLALILSLTLIVPMTPITSGQPPRPNHIIIATIGEPETLDPAWLYDTASAEICMHIYEPLIAFNVTRDATGYIVDPKTAGQTGEFVPALAMFDDLTSDCQENINETSPLGLNWLERWTFEIDTSATFHCGGNVTPQDVEYSFERWMVQDRTGGPTWMILEPLLGCYHIRDVATPDNATGGKMVDHAVESNTTHVWFNLVMRYAPFPAIIAQSWAGILSYDYQISLSITVSGAPRAGDWPGAGVAFEDRWGTYTDWVFWHDPAVSPIDQAYATVGEEPCGAGPYMFDYWSKGVEWEVDAYADYYQGWPAPELPTEASGDEITRVTVKIVPEWILRQMMFLAGDCEFVYVPRQNIPDLPAGLCVKDLPLLVCSPCLFYTYDIATTSPFMGVSGGLPVGTYNESGIPPDFFNNSDVRNAFSYCINYTKYLTEVYMGEAALCTDPIIEGLPYDNPAQTAPWFPSGDLGTAKTHFQAVPDLWTNGFTIGVTYSTGDTERQKACEMLKTAIESPGIGNAKFHVDVYEVDSPTYMDHLVHSELTCFIQGRLADFPDAHSFAMHFMHSYGDFSWFQQITYGQSGRMQIDYTVNGVHYGDPLKVIDNNYVDEMIENGVKTTNDTERQAIYYELQAIYVAENIGVPLCKPTGRHWQRGWVQGWYYNPIYPGIYAYHYWKVYPTTPTDVDVGITDIEPPSITLWLINQPYHDPRPGVPWMKYNPSTGGTEPQVVVNATVERTDAETGVIVFVYLKFVGNTSKKHYHEFGYSTEFLYADETIYVAGNVSEEYPDPSHAYTLGVYCYVLGAAINNTNLTPHFIDDWFRVLGFCDINGDDVVDVIDYQQVKVAIPSTPGDANWKWTADVNCDDVIDVMDYQMVKSTIPTTYSSA